MVEDKSNRLHEMNHTIQYLSKICEKYPFKEKLLFVPSYGVGHQVGEVLARERGSWINLRMSTVGGYAQELVTPDLGEAGIRLIDPHEHFLIIEEILRGEDGLEDMGGYFKGAPDIPGIIRCLGHTIQELRMAGMKAGNIDPAVFLVAQKGEELQRLLQSYQTFLSDNGLIDRAGVITMALQKMKKEGRPGGKGLVLVLSDFPLAALEKQFIRLVGGKELKVIPHSRPAALETPPRFFQPINKVKEKTPEPEADIHLWHWVFDAEKAPAPMKDGTVSLFHALGESNEVREVFRGILGQGIPADHVEILVTKTEPYISLIHEIASTLDIPVTFSGGIPITYTRPGKALVLYLQWQAEDFLSAPLRRLFSGGYIDLERVPLKGEKPSQGKAAAVIREAGIGWGRERYEGRLKALQGSYLARAGDLRERGKQERAEWAEKQAAQVDWVSRFIKKMLASITQKDPCEELTLENLCQAGVAFLEKSCRIAGDMDGAARNKLVETLNALARAPSKSDTAKDMLERVIDMVEETSIRHSNPRPGHVHVSHYRMGGYSGRSNTFVLGLDQAKFPGPLLQDPVILDRERKRCSPALPLARDLLEEDPYTLCKVLCSLKGKVCLGYSCRDLHEDRDVFPSSLMLSAYRLITGDHQGDYSALKGFLGPPAGFIPPNQAFPLNHTEWWLSQRHGNYGSDSVLETYGHLLEGERAEEEREKEILTQYDGWLPSSEGTLDPVNTDAVLSSSRLEDLAKCPFAFFLRHVLGIEPIQDLEKDPGRWLDPLQRGELLHDVFCRFMEERKDKSERPRLARHLKRFEAIAMEEVEQWKKVVPPSSELSFEREIKDIKLALQMFLKGEEERPKTTRPAFFELSFGTAWEKGCGRVIQEPVEIALSRDRRFRLRGRIDRVDQRGEHEYEVWDYKTGSSSPYKEQAYINQGKHLQHALYAVAAEILLRRDIDKKARVVESGYLFPTPKGEGERRGKALKREELFEVLDTLFELLKTGRFPATYDGRNCLYCDYVRTCGGKDVAVAHTLKKMKTDKRLTLLERLKAHA